MKKIFLITKLRTSNLGNEALSNEIIRLFSEINQDNIIHVAGRPMGLDGYYVNRIIRSKNPEKKLDNWADRIIRKINSESPKTLTRVVPKIELLLQESPQLKYESFKAKLRPWKRVLSGVKVYSAAYAGRAAVLKDADWLVYSGAGEVGDYSVFLRQLLEIRVAQKMGVNTAAVNQSVVLHTPFFRRMCAHVYGKMKKIVVRGEVTSSTLQSYGVPSSIIDIAPDSAINAEYSGNVKRDKDSVGLNLTPKCKASPAQIKRIVDHLRERGKTITFISNEPFEDNNLAEYFEKEFGIEVVRNQASYHDYMKKLAGFGMVISARLHTNIMCLDVQTPIIPIEGNVFKTKELLTQLKYPVDTIDPSKENWDVLLTENVDAMLNGSYKTEQYFNEILPEQKRNVKKNASWLNQL